MCQVSGIRHHLQSKAREGQQLKASSRAAQSTASGMDQQQQQQKHPLQPSEMAATTPTAATYGNASMNGAQANSSTPSFANQPSLSQAFSPTIEDASVALLSPPSSRYAFDPQSTSQLDSMMSPLLTISMGNLNSNAMSSFNLDALGTTTNGTTIVYNNLNNSGNDIPAFDPETELNLQKFTSDLQYFSSWMKNLNSEQQKTSLGIFIESITDPDVLEFMRLKVDSAAAANLNSVENDADVKSITFSPPLSANTSMPHNLRPISPIVSAISDVPTTLDSILNDTSLSGYSHSHSHSHHHSHSNSHNYNNNNIGSGTGSTGNSNNNFSSLNYTNDGMEMELQRPTPRRMLSPPIMKTGFSNMTEGNGMNVLDSRNAMRGQMGMGIERRKSAGPMNFTNQQAPPTASNPMSPLLTPQHLTRVFSDGTGEMSNGYTQFNNVNSMPDLNGMNNMNSMSMNNMNNMNSIMGMNNMNNMNGMNGMNNANYGMNLTMGMGNLSLNDSDPGMLGAKLQHSLNTINNRSLLDSSKQHSHHYAQKEERGRQRFLQNRHMNNHGNGSGNANVNGIGNANYIHNHSGKHHLNATSLDGNGGHSSSLPPINRVRSDKGALSGLKKAGVSPTSPFTPLTTNAALSHSKSSGHVSSLTGDTTITESSSNSSSGNMPKDIASDVLLNDIPAWLKALRLHKYTENMQGLKWEEMVRLDDSGLSALGVSTVGARNKLLKSFTYVLEQRGMAP
jgi:hypothetical protein